MIPLILNCKNIKTNQKIDCTVNIEFLTKAAEHIVTTSKADSKNYKELLTSVFSDESKTDKATLKFCTATITDMEDYIKNKLKIIQQPGLYYIQTSLSLLPINSHQRLQKFSTFTGNPIVGAPIVLAQGDTLAYICIEEATEWGFVNGYSPCNDGSRALFSTGVKKGAIQK
jgi:hypothetical protein